MRDETLAIHGGYSADSKRALAVPIYQTVAHDFIDHEHAGAVFDLEIPGFHYTRMVNPTVEVLEKRLTYLEEGAASVCVTSGAAAVSTPAARSASSAIVHGSSISSTLTL